MRFRPGFLTVLLALCSAAAGNKDTHEPVPLPAPGLATDRATLDARRLERLLRFALERARDGVAAEGSVGVYLGRGVFPPSAIAVVRRLDRRRLEPRLVFEDDLTREGLAQLEVLIVPGGWAPSQRDSMGRAGRDALGAFVKKGGNYLGICAGGYLACTSVVWEGESFPYPLELARGTATGPVRGLAPWPQAEVFQLELASGRKSAALYAGGSSFDVEGADVLARYPDGSAAAIGMRHGKGRLILTGAHIELRSSDDKDLLAEEDWASGLAPGDASVFDEFLTQLLGRNR